MSGIAIVLTATFLSGLLAAVVRLPALLGFLLAGFVLNALGVSKLPYLDFVADLGVTLLLFGIGLKLNVRQLFAREICVTSVAHMALSVVLGTMTLWLVGLLGLPLVSGVDIPTLAIVAFALSFCSTVFVVKTLEEQAELQSFYGRIAIGVLVLQDFAAVVFMVVSGGQVPSPWAIPVLVLLAPIAWMARRLWGRIPHGELRALFGLAMALGPGYALFEAVGLKGDLGALVMGMLLAGHIAATELSHTLFLLKDLLLVGFFLSIGFVGVPSLRAVGLGLALLLLVPFQVVLYIALFHWQRLRRRTSVKAGLLLGNFSEFGLIVTTYAVSAALLDEAWLVVMSVAVASSFVVAALLNEWSDAILAMARRILPRRSTEAIHHREKPISFGDARALVMGMGRIGRSVYRDLTEVYGLSVLGVENLPSRVDELRAEGITVVEADAADSSFWHRLESTHQIDIVVLAMPFHGTNQLALEQLVASDYRGVVAAVAQYDDQVADLERLGADVVIHLYEGAGSTLAERAADAAAER